MNHINRPAPVAITEAAAERLKGLMAATAGEPAIGLRLGVSTKGCSGLSYTMDYATSIEPGEQVIEQHGIKLIVDPRAMMYLIGTQMDYVDDTMQSGFVFSNPNEKGRCGCGESFHV